jgi:hypothetical protein
MGVISGGAGGWLGAHGWYQSSVVASPVVVDLAARFAHGFVKPSSRRRRLLAFASHPLP